MVLVCGAASRPALTVELTGVRYPKKRPLPARLSYRVSHCKVMTSSDAQRIDPFWEDTASRSSQKDGLETCPVLRRIHVSDFKKVIYIYMYDHLCFMNAAIYKIPVKMSNVWGPWNGNVAGCWSSVAAFHSCAGVLGLRQETDWAVASWKQWVGERSFPVSVLVKAPPRRVIKEIHKPHPSSGWPLPSIKLTDVMVLLPHHNNKQRNCPQNGPQKK